MDTKKLTQEELGKKLNEKMSIIKKIENEELEPGLVLAKKLENFLSVKLVNEDRGEIDFKDKKLTVGDLLKLKDEK